MSNRAFRLTILLMTMIVKKPDGTNKFYIDFRVLNKITVFDCEPMPTAVDIFAMLKGCKYFSKFNLTKAFWHMPMRLDDHQKTAFSKLNVHLHFIRMPFGLVNVTATFNRMMQIVLKGVENVASFVDDVLCLTESWNESFHFSLEAFEESVL